MSNRQDTSSGKKLMTNTPSYLPGGSCAGPDPEALGAIFHTEKLHNVRQAHRQGVRPVFANSLLVVIFAYLLKFCPARFWTRVYLLLTSQSVALEKEGLQRAEISELTRDGSWSRRGQRETHGTVSANSDCITPTCGQNSLYGGM